MFENNLVFNQNYEKIYGVYKSIINEAHNLFISDKRNREDICPDDGLIATAIILLQREETSIGIISNDRGISHRIRIFNSLLYYLGKEEITSKRTKNIFNLMGSEGISLYSLLNEGGKYRLYGATSGRGMRYSIKYEKGYHPYSRKTKPRFKKKEWEKNLIYFRNLFNSIDSLEKKYGKIT